MKFFNNIQYQTFKETALARGLLKDDIEWERCLREAAFLKMPKALRNLFCTICVFSNPSNPNALFEKFKNDLIEDFIHQNQSIENATNKCLLEFDIFFKIHGKNCEFFLGDKNKPDYSHSDNNNNNENVSLTEDKATNTRRRTKNKIKH